MLKTLVSSSLLAVTLSQTSFAAPINFPNKAVRVYLMEWTWPDVARECTDYLGPNGFKGVLVSAPNEHANVDNFNGQVHPWFERYGSVSYKIGNRSGTRAQFKAMVDTCKAAGVEVYTDTILNHMASTVPQGQTHCGIQGSCYTHYNHPDAGYVFADFHHFNDGCSSPDNEFHGDYQDALAVRGCRFSSLSDLKTETAKVQNILAAYLKDLMSLGVAGFRLDAAKHINDRDLKSIMTKAGGNPSFVMSEVIGWVDQPVNGFAYLDIGSVTVSSLGTHVSKFFKNGQAWKLNEWGNTPIGENWQLEPSAKAVVYIDNQDTQRDDPEILNYKSPELYKLANLFMLAYPYGSPMMMSSFYFENRNWGAPHEANGSIRSVFAPDGSMRCGSREWICEHRWPLFRRMVGFRNFTDDSKDLQNWWSNRAGQIAFSRGNKGFVAINTETGSMNQSLQTGLAAGEYCDLYSSEYDYTSQSCNAENGGAGKWVVVGTDGKAAVSLSARSAIAIHSGARKSTGGPASVRMTGNFNGWNAAGTGSLTKVGGDTWQADLLLSAGLLEYKFTVNGAWAGAFGDNGEIATLPQTGTARNTSGIGNISIQLKQTGLYRVSFNSFNGQYSLSWAGGNLPPVANAGADITVDKGTLVNFDGSASTDADGSIVKYEWSNGLSGMRASQVYPTVGEFNVVLTVTDDQNAQSTDTLTVKVREPGLDDWRRTVVYIYGQTQSGQDMFVRGGLDHAAAKSQLGLTCTEANKLCAMPIRHLNLKNATTAPWKANDQFLDWYGTEAGQAAAAQGSALDWTTDIWPASWGAKKTVAINGFGEDPQNKWGQHYWKLDVEMNCSRTANGWFELKSFISNGPGWEPDIRQAGAPYVSGNHFAQCGKINVFKRGDASAQFLPLN